MKNLKYFIIASISSIILTSCCGKEAEKISALELEIQKMRISHSGQVAIFKSEKESLETERDEYKKMLDETKKELENLKKELENTKKELDMTKNELLTIPQKKSKKIFLNNNEYYIDFPINYDIFDNYKNDTISSFKFNKNDNIEENIQLYEINIYNKQSIENCNIASGCSIDIARFDRMKYDFKNNQKYIENDIVYEIYKIGDGYYYVKNEKNIRKYITFLDDFMIEIAIIFNKSNKVQDNFIPAADKIISKTKVYK